MRTKLKGLSERLKHLEQTHSGTLIVHEMHAHGEWRGTSIRYGEIDGTPEYVCSQLIAGGILLLADDDKAAFTASLKGRSLPNGTSRR